MRAPRMIVLLSCFAFGVARAEEKKEWEHSAELSLLLTSGNTEISTFGVGGASAYKPDPWAVKAKANYLRSSDSGLKKAESFEAELRGERKLSEPLSIFVLANYLKNQFSGFNDRFGAETGANYLLLKQEAHELSTELGVGVIKENRTDNTIQNFVTGRIGARYAWRFSENGEFSTQTSFIENFQTTRDWRIRNVNSVTAILTSVLSLKASFAVEHLNTPVMGKKKTDTTTTIALVAKF